MRSFVLLAVLAAAPLLAGEVNPLVKEGRAIRELVAAHSEAWNRGDWKTYAALHTEDFDAPDAQERGGQLTTSFRQIHFVRPDVALVDMDYRLAGRQGRKTFLVEKRGGGWIIAAERTAPAPPQATMAVSGQ